MDGAWETDPEKKAQAFADTFARKFSMPAVEVNDYSEVFHENDAVDAAMPGVDVAVKLLKNHL